MGNRHLGIDRRLEWSDKGRAGMICLALVAEFLFGHGMIYDECIPYTCTCGVIILKSCSMHWLSWDALPTRVLLHGRLHMIIWNDIVSDDRFQFHVNVALITRGVAV